MNKPASPRKQWTFRRILIGLTLIDIVLVLLGLFLYPKVIQAGGLSGAGAATFMIGCYGFLALHTPIRSDKADVRLWKPGAMVGAIGGFWLGGDLLSNYFIYRDGPTNSRISLVVYGVYVLMLMGTALRGTLLTSRVKGGLIAAMWYVIMVQLIWVFVELSAYYLFAQTRVGLKFIQTEMQADFQRSGMADFQTFVIGDFFGAVFFHLLLIGLVAGLVFGSIAGAIGRAISILKRSAR